MSCCAISHKGQMLKLAWWGFQLCILLMKCDPTAVLIFKDAVRVQASWIIDLFDGMFFHTVNTEIYKAHAYVLDKWVDTVNTMPYIFICWSFNFLGRTKAKKKRCLLMYDVPRASYFEDYCRTSCVYRTKKMQNLGWNQSRPGRIRIYNPVIHRHLWMPLVRRRLLSWVYFYRKSTTYCR